MPHRGSEGEHGEKKKNSRNLKPQNMADTPEGPEEAGYAARQSRAGSARRAAALLSVRAPGSGLSARYCSTCTRIGGQTLAGHTTCHAHPDAEYPPDRLRSHFDMMVTAGEGSLLCTDFRAALCCSQLPMAVR
jgi:hypothetical protein